MRPETFVPHGPSPSWSAGLSIPIPVAEPYGGAVNRRLIVVEGIGGVGTFAYNSGLQSWTQLADAPIRRVGAACASFGGKLFCVGGEEVLQPATTDALYIFDERANRWSAGSPLPFPVTRAGAAALNGKIYVFGGFNFEVGSYVRSVYCYDPATDTWTSLGFVLNAARTIGACVEYGGKAYLFGTGGRSSGVGDTLLEVYDPATNTSTSFGVGSLPGSLTGGSAALVNDEIHIFGMDTPAGHDIYDPSRNSWRPGFPLLSPNSVGVAGLMLDHIGVATVMGNEFYEFGPFTPPLRLIEKD